MVFCYGSLSRLIQTSLKLLTHIHKLLCWKVLLVYTTPAVYKEPHCFAPSRDIWNFFKLYFLIQIHLYIYLSILLKFFEAHSFNILFLQVRLRFHGILSWMYHYILKFPVSVIFHRDKNVHSGIPKQSQQTHKKKI